MNLVSHCSAWAFHSPIRKFYELNESLKTKIDQIKVIAPKWNIGASHCVSHTFDRPEQMRMLCGVHDRTITGLSGLIELRNVLIGVF